MDDADRDLFARTIVGEASNQLFEGQQAVANVILNRLRSGKHGSSIADVVLAPYQFEPWQTRKAELMAIRPDSPAYQKAIQAIDAASGSDVTGGATHFLQPETVMRRSGKLPAWAQGPSQRIGDHAFFSPDGTVASAFGAPAPAQTAPAQMAAYAPPQNQPRQESNIADIFSHVAQPQPNFNQRQAPAQPFGADNSVNSYLEDQAQQRLFQPRTTQAGKPKPKRH